MTGKRVIVIGCPGSGKSRFSRLLHEHSGLPLVYLDRLYWRADRSHLEREEFIALLKEKLEEDEWIMDGDYISSMELRLKRCDTVFFFDYPTEICIQGIRERIGKARPELPWLETEEDAEFYGRVLRFREEIRPRILDLLETYSYVNQVRFYSREDTDAYLEKLKKESKY